MMVEALLLLAWMTPLLLAVAVVVSPRLTWKVLAFAGLPGLAAAVMVPPGSMIDISGLLLGTRFGLDQVGAGFLFFTSAIWIAAGWYAGGYVRVRRNSFGVHFLLAMSGNLGLVLAQDMVGFYLFFALMSFASYGLVIHDRNASVRYAGKVYLILVVVGEVLIFSGMAGVATLAGATRFSEVGAGWIGQPGWGWFFGALFLGFGIKAGALPLHVWLPLAHPAAPTPASAVLSGAMIKAGLLGWLRFLPIGETAVPGWGAFGMGLGALAFVGAGLYGCLQTNSKVLLAYSSISKMGLLTMVVGVVLAKPGTEALLVPCILVYAIHHCFCKGALFLSVSIDRSDVPSGLLRWLTTLLMLVPPLSLAGFVWTSGAAVKTALQLSFSASLGLTAQSGVASLLLLDGVVTAALMFRFCWQRLTRSSRNHHPPGIAAYRAWVVLVLTVMVTPLLLMKCYPELVFGKGYDPAAWWSAVWPTLVGSGLGAVLIFHPRLSRVQVPPGDLLQLYTLLPGSIARQQLTTRLGALVPANRLGQWLLEPGIRRVFKTFLRQGELRLGQTAVFGLLFFGLLSFITLLLYYYL